MALTEGTQKRKLGRMPKVAIIGTRGYPSYYGGFETAVRYLAPYLANEGWDVTVYGRRGTTVSDDPNIDTRVKSVNTFGFETKALSTLSYGLSATTHAFAKKPDVALVMNVANGYFLPLLRARGIPTLVNVDGIEWERDKWGRAAKSVFKIGAKATARFANELVFDADAIGDYWRSNLQRDGVVIPYGGQFRDEMLPIEPGLTHRGYVLVVARFVPENSIVEFFDAVELLDDKVPVVIVGSSGYGGELDQRAQYLSSTFSNVHWLGHVSDDSRLHSLWQHAGVYFHGHSVGGTNPALVQAMALGAPTLARDTVYNHEVLGDIGLFTSPDSRTIAAKIQKHFNQVNELEIRSVNLVQRAKKLYTWDKVTSEYSRVLKSLVS